MMEDFATTEISDALIKLSSPHGGFIADVTKRSPTTNTRIEGPAYTVQMVLFSDKTAPKPEKHFVDAIPSGHIVVIDAPPVKSAVWGGLMTSGAKARGALGVIISGRCRDIGEHIDASFPVFARGTSTLGQKPFTKPSSLNVPLVISAQSPGGGIDAEWPPVEVRPGDWIVADDDGVVCIPLELMGKVKELCRVGREVDKRCKEDIEAGKGIEETFKKWRG